MEYKRVLEQFIEENGLREKEEVEGILFYGSYASGFEKPNSSLDMLIVTNQYNAYQGGIKIHPYQLDYLVKPACLVSRDIAVQICERNNSYVSIFKHGNILYDPHGEMKSLKTQTEKVYQKPLSKMQMTEFEKNKVFVLHDAVFELGHENSKFFPVYYYQLLEEIRRNYHRIHAYSSLPCTKIYDIYKDPVYAKEAFCAVLPDQEFIKTYLEAVTDGLSIEERLQKIDSLYKMLPASTNGLRPTSSSSFILSKQVKKEQEQPKRGSHLQPKVFPGDIYSLFTSYVLRKESYVALSESEEKQRYMTLYHSYQQVDYAVLNQAPNSDALYYQLVNSLEKFHEKRSALSHYEMRDRLQNNVDVDSLDPDVATSYLQALDASTKEEKSAALSQLLAATSKNINIHPQHYQFQLTKI